MGGNGNGNNNNGNGELTGLQRAFVEQWFECRFNGTEAAKRAGYKGDRGALASVASVNLRKPKVQLAIADRWTEHGGSSEEMVARLVAWMRFDMSVLFDAHGNLDWAQVKKHGEMIKRIEWDRGNKLKVEVHDPMRAAELLGKFLVLAEEQAKGAVTQFVIDI